MSRHESKYPAKLKKGDTIGVAAPSSPFDNDEFINGVSVLESMGFHVHVPEEIWEKKAYLAGADEKRAAVINRLFADPAIDAIVCARGGYGVLRILGQIDFDLIRKNPKPFIGFSDITALLSVFNQQCGFAPYHGPMVCSLGKSDDNTIRAFETILTTDNGGGIGAENGRVIIPGKAEGLLKGGNLATLCHLTGTDYQPEFKDSILMLEDVAEPPYKLDRMLTQMKYAGYFETIRAVVGGSFERCGDVDDITEIFKHIFADFHIPVALDFPFGHGRTNMAFPLGVSAIFDTDSLSVVF